MSMSTESFDWIGVQDRLSGVRDDDLRSAALLIAHDVWSSRAARGKTCSLQTLCWRSVQLARRRAARDRRVDVCSAAVECAPAIVAETRDVPRLRLDRLTARQQTIADLVMQDVEPHDIAARVGCGWRTVYREIERMADAI